MCAQIGSHRRDLVDVVGIDGHEVRTAGNGAEALAQIEKFQPHAAFVEIGMPVLNGYEVAQAVR